MKLGHLLPARLRVATTTLQQDASNVVRAFRSTRTKTFRQHHMVRTTEGEREMEIEVQVRVPIGVPVPAEEVLAVIQFGDSGVEVVVTDPEMTLLQAGLNAGVDMLYSCALGGCGACMLSVHSGLVEYEDRDAICLTDDEIDDGMCLACVGRPRGQVVVTE